MIAKLTYKNKIIEIPNIEKVSGFKKFTGLMFKPQNNNPLLFEFPESTKQAIHSLFCPYFLAIWLDKENKVIDYKIISPNQFIIKPKQEFAKLIEIPINKQNSEVVNFLVGK